VGALKQAQSRTGASLGLVTPKTVENVTLVQKPRSERQQYDSKMARAQEQRDMFRPEYKELEYLSHNVRIAWRCLGSCSECRRRPHGMKVLDWGLLELGRREGWEAARSKLDKIADLQSHDFRLFMGSFRLYPTVFGVIGLWYPKRKTQLELL
jgi:hypothetical protein